MTFEEIYPVWRTIRDRFNKMVKGLNAEDLALKLTPETQSVGYMVRHNAEVEYMFADWFFGCSMPADVKIYTSGGSAKSEDDKFANLEELATFLEAADSHISEAMRVLPEAEWDESKTSVMGPSTPREAFGRLLYHTGIHAGQISLIIKSMKAANKA